MLISKEAALKTVKKFVPEKTYELNLRAFDRGIELAKEQVATAQTTKED